MLTDLLSYMNFTFTMCFTFEAILKLIAFGPGVSRDGGDILWAVTQRYFVFNIFGISLVRWDHQGTTKCHYRFLWLTSVHIGIIYISSKLSFMMHVIVHKLYSKRKYRSRRQTSSIVLKPLKGTTHLILIA